MLDEDVDVSAGQDESPRGGTSTPAHLSPEFAGGSTSRSFAVAQAGKPPVTVPRFPSNHTARGGRAVAVFVMGASSRR